MQSVCALFPTEYFDRVVALRSTLCEDQTLGAIYDPPFVHFTLQLAEEYDWDGLSSALAGFAATWQPFALSTTGLLAFTGQGTAITVAPYKSRQLTEFQAAVWETITPFAQGRVDPFYHPDRWLPHVTVKRCGPHPASFGGAMAKLASENLVWTMTIDNVAVQHDPGKNSLTHYLRLHFPLGGSGAQPPGRDIAPAELNATIRAFRESKSTDGAPVWLATIEPDREPERAITVAAPALVRLMAAARCSFVHFPGARCQVEGDVFTGVTIVTPRK